VAGRGVDDLGAAAGLDGEVVQVGVVADHDGGNRLGLVLAGLGAGGEDLVAGVQGGRAVLPRASRTLVPR
jgi:hypothetical protein